MNHWNKDDPADSSSGKLLSSLVECGIDRIKISLEMAWECRIAAQTATPQRLSSTAFVSRAQASSPAKSKRWIWK